MAVTTPRETWTDPRIDDLSKKVDAGFEKADKRMDALDKKMDAGFEKADKKMEAGFTEADAKMKAGFARVDADVRELRGEMRSGFDKFDKKFDRLLWGFLAIAASSSATLIHALAIHGG